MFKCWKAEVIFSFLNILQRFQLNNSSMKIFVQGIGSFVSSRAVYAHSCGLSHHLSFTLSLISPPISPAPAFRVLRWPGCWHSINLLAMMRFYGWHSSPDCGGKGFHYWFLYHLFFRSAVVCLTLICIYCTHLISIKFLLANAGLKGTERVHSEKLRVFQ